MREGDLPSVTSSGAESGVSGPPRTLLRLIIMDVGVYTRAELRRRDLDGWALRKQLENGSLRSLRTGWYAIPTADPDVVEAVRLGGALSCVSALRKRQLWVPPGYDRVHVRTSRYGKQQVRRSCQGPGRPVPVETALDPIPIALGCAYRCMTAEDWITVCDSALNTFGLTIPQLQSEMGVLSPPMYELMRNVTRSRSRARNHLRDCACAPQASRCTSNRASPVSAGLICGSVDC